MKSDEMEVVREGKSVCKLTENSVEITTKSRRVCGRSRKIKSDNVQVYEKDLEQ